uniref:hypothetical protein n=1 Tax=Asticcacaulis sp. AC460 TaxID=1282360 RepID=UPI003510A24F
MTTLSDIVTMPSPSGGRVVQGSRTVTSHTVDGVEIKAVDNGVDIITGHPTNLPWNP